MSIRLSSRALALVAGASLVFGATTVAAPAFAEGQAVVPPAAGESTTPPTAGTVDYTGRLTQVSDESTANPASRLFRVIGSGYLRVDVSKVQLGGLVLADVTLRFAVPSTLTLSSDADAKFQQLATYSTGTKPLVATAVVPASPSRTKAMVNQSPATAAVHSIYAVLVTPKEFAGSTASANQTEAKVRASVTHADTYWSNQSGGKVHFQLAGTTTWYKSTKSCLDDSSAIWTEAAAKAASQLGYRDALNTHLALFFPEDPTGTICDGALGLGTIGYSVNSGGWVWVEGTDAAISQAALAHELGHNLTFGHADLLSCTSSDPHPGFLGDQGCVLPDSGNALNGEYGDVTDVMGFGTDGKDGGAISSPNAIRSGLWSSDAYVSAPSGTNSYTLSPISSHSGLRSVIVEDADGVDYFVEYRNQTNEDAQFAGYGCDADACASATPSVRVLRLQQQDLGGGLYLKGLDGDDTYLIGRNIGGTEHFDYHAGEVFTSRLGGITISVTSVGASSAVVSVSRPPMNTSGSDVGIYFTLSHDNSARVGDTWTAMLSSGWVAQSYSFQWYRGVGGNDAVPILGATAQSYTLTNNDRGNYIAVSVTGSTPGSFSSTSTDPDLTIYNGYGPILAKVSDPLPIGAVTVTNGPAALQAVPAGWPAATSYAYQWFRDASVIAGATSSSYKPTSADLGHNLKVRVIGSKAGFLSSTAFSEAKDYSISIDTGTIGIPTTTPPDSPQRVGDILSVNSSLNFKTVDGPIASPQLSYQWYRAGVAIAGATAATYPLAAADVGKSLNVSVTARSLAYAPLTVTSPATAAPTALGVIDVSSGPTVAEPVARVLVSSIPADAVAVPGVTTTYQWVRATDDAHPAVAIAGATGKTYALTSADVGKTINVEYTFTKAGYGTTHLFGNGGVGKNYSTTVSGVPVIIGTAKVGELLGVTLPSYSTVDGPVASPVATYQWYRSGVAVAGAAGIGSTYRLTASDYAKTITVRVTGSRSGYLTVLSTSAATLKVGTGVLLGTLDATVTKTTAATSFTLKAQDSITEPGVTRAYQWYRSGAAIKGATKVSYVPTSADYGKTIAVHITVSKLDYQAQAATTPAVDYSLKPDYHDPIGDHFSYLAVSTLPRIVGDVVNSQTLSVATPIVTVGGDPVDPDQYSESYQWYRAGVAIPAAQHGKESTHTLSAADVGKGISVAVTITEPGFLPVTTLSPRTQLVGANTALMPGANNDYHLVVQPTGEGVGVTLEWDHDDGIQNPPLTDPPAPPVTRTFQWYRDAVAIPGATKFNYTLTAADYEKHVWLREVVSRASYTPIVKESTAPDYSVHATGTVAVILNTLDTVRVGATLGVNSTLAYATDAGPLTSDDMAAPTYQWLRSGAPILGAISDTYTLVAADYGKAISVKVTSGQISNASYLPAIRTSPATASVAKGIIVVGATTRPQISSGVVLSTAYPLLTATWTIDETGTTPSYQWYRAGVAIKGATHVTYQTAVADVAKSLTVRMVRAKSNFGSVTATSNAFVVTPLIALDAPVPVIDASGGVVPGQTLAIISRKFTASGIDVSGDVEPFYQWYRNGIAVVGETDASYLLTPLDLGKVMTVRVTTTLNGHVSSIGTSAATFPVATTLLDGWNVPAHVTVTKTGTTMIVLHAGDSGVTIPASSQPDPPAAPLAAPTTAYQWYRGAAAIAAATHETYTLVAADTGQDIWVREIVTHAASGATTFATALKTSVRHNYTVTASGLPTLDDTTPVRVTNSPVHVVLAATYTLPADDFNDESVTIPDLMDTSVSIQWYRNGVAIAGATGQAYQPVLADKGKRLSVRVTVRNSGFLASVTTSAQSAVVP